MSTVLLLALTCGLAVIGAALVCLMIHFWPRMVRDPDARFYFGRSR